TLLRHPPPPRSTPFPYTTLFRSDQAGWRPGRDDGRGPRGVRQCDRLQRHPDRHRRRRADLTDHRVDLRAAPRTAKRLRAVLPGRSPRPHLAGWLTVPRSRRCTASVACLMTLPSPRLSGDKVQAQLRRSVVREPADQGAVFLLACRDRVYASYRW